MNRQPKRTKTAIVSEKGQITIPKRLRERLGLAPGTVLEFRAEKGRLIAQKAESRDDPVLSVTGIIDLDTDVGEYLDDLRGPVE